MSLRIVAVAAMDAAKLEAEVSPELGRVAPSRSLGSVDGLVALEWQVPGIRGRGQPPAGPSGGEGAPRRHRRAACSSGRKRLLISDMDSTIIGQECLDELADFAGLKAEVSAITERAMRGELDFEGALTTRVAMLKGLGLDALEHAYAERITLNPGAKTLVETMKADGAETVLVSGGFTYFTSRVAAAAGFHTHRGNTLIDDGKALTGEVGRPILGREAKLAALDEFAAAKGIGRDDVIAMGDGANDLAMIKASGLGIAYHAKPVVAAEAHAAIEHTDLRAALFFQGYEAKEFVG
jgi:phosphoserine phosphatase